WRRCSMMRISPKDGKHRPSRREQDMTLDIDIRVRVEAFRWLQERSRANSGVFARKELEEGVVLEGQQVRLVGPQGIFKPRILPEVQLSITTTTSGPYADTFGADGLLRYSYRGTDPMHHENVGLRTAMSRQIPLVYFHSLMPSRYIAAWPVYIREDEAAKLVFVVQVDDALAATRLENLQV